MNIIQTRARIDSFALGCLLKMEIIEDIFELPNTGRTECLSHSEWMIDTAASDCQCLSRIWPNKCDHSGPSDSQEEKPSQSWRSEPSVGVFNIKAKTLAVLVLPPPGPALTSLPPEQQALGIF